MTSTSFLASRRGRTVAWRLSWLLIAGVGIAAISPWRSVDNAGEVAAAQGLVDAMSSAHRSIADGDARIADFTLATDAFQGFTTSTSSGVPALALIGASGDDCLLLHWTEPFEAQVGRLEPDRPCAPASVTTVPLPEHDGYVAGTGPPFDVTDLVRVTDTPVWFVVALLALSALAIRALTDLFLVATRPDQFE